MNTSRRPRVLLLSAILVSAGAFFVFISQREARVARQRVQALQAERAQWLARAAAPNPSSDSRLKNISATADNPAVTSALTGAASVPSTSDTVGVIDALATLHLRSLEADVRLTCARFFRSRALSPEQIAAFARRVAESNRETMIRWSSQPVAGRWDPSNPNTAALREATQRQQAALETDLVALIGRDAYSDYQKFLSTQGHWSYVTSLATQLHRTETPLSPAQAAQLADLLIAQSTSAANNVARQPSNWDTVFVQAGAILSPTQVATFKALKERKDLQQEISRMIFRTR